MLGELQVVLSQPQSLTVIFLSRIYNQRLSFWFWSTHGYHRHVVYRQPQPRQSG